MDVKDPQSATLIHALGLDYYKFSASGEAASDIQPIPNDVTALRFKVTRIGTIRKVASLAAWKQQDIWEMAEENYPVSDPLNQDDIQELVHSSFQVIDAPPLEEITLKDEDLMVNFSRAFFCDFSFEGKRFSEPGVVETAFLKVVLHNRRTLSESEPIVAECLRRILISCVGRIYGMRFCQAISQGQVNEDSAPALPLIGWVPKESVVGDVLVVIHGFRMPMVLRRVPGLEERYRFLGISYIHGMMDGHAIEHNDSHGEYIVVL
jgi:hypothetical protein